MVKDAQAKLYHSASRYARGKFLEGGVSGLVELLGDGSVLKSLHVGLDEEVYSVEIRAEGGI
jgi:hypothetical protein